MVDAHALGACGANRAGSSPASPTKPRWQRRFQSELSVARFELGRFARYVCQPTRLGV